MPDIMHFVQIHVPLEPAYQAVTKAEGIRGWWTRDVALGARVGETGEFGFNEHRFVVKVRVEELEPPVRVGWKVISGAPGWEGTTIGFDLRADGSDTVLSFTHRGFKQATEGYASATTRWGAYLVSLKQFLETGKGAPNPEDVFAEPVARRTTDFRIPTDSKLSAPRAVADGGEGTIIATADVSAPPERVFRALTTDEVERWWGHPDFYRQTDWKADLRVCGQWTVMVRFPDGTTNGASGEFAEIDPPRKVVMTRRFEQHPLLGTRETTVTYRFDPIATSTRVTVRDEGFLGRGQAAYGNAEHWGRVLGWLAAYLESDNGGAL
jgi:uncharacterized protein YndB with AHSA1/START domain